MLRVQGNLAISAELIAVKKGFNAIYLQALL